MKNQSIATRTGDTGETDLMFGRRVPKTDPRIGALGAVDELNAALGLVRASGGIGGPLAIVPQVQDDLIALMGELSHLPEDAGRYDRAGYARLEEAALQRLDAAVADLEGGAQARSAGWATPGGSGHLEAAHLDMARAVCRRAERALWALEGFDCPRAKVFLNRLSDVLWLLARSVGEGLNPELNPR
ncbi:cob(I)yrinic acid a,c-diamide adenosyltransferase [soil metagenome]